MYPTGKRATDIQEATLLPVRTRQNSLSPIQEITRLAATMDGVTSLGWGVPSFEMPAHIKEAVWKALSDNPSIDVYSPTGGVVALREAIAARIERESHVKIDPLHEVLITAGAMEATFIALTTLVHPGDEVLLTSPCFGTHAEQIQLVSGQPVYVPLLEERGWHLNVADVEKAISSRTRAMIITTPLNPTGSITGEQELRKLVELAIKHNFYLITDETYRFLTYDGKKVFNAFRIPGARERLISCYSFSKEYAMTGWRVGYICASDQLIQEFVKVHDATVVSTPHVSQIAALAALEGPQDCVEEFKLELTRRKSVMCQRLDRLNMIFSYQQPEGAYYIFPQVTLPNVNTSVFALQLLTKAKVVTIPGDAFGPGWNTHLRLCFACDSDQIAESFDRLERFVDDPHLR